jgi:hypothetical protein
MLGERGMHKKADGTARLKHRAVTRMLWKKRPPGLAPRPHTKARPARIGKQTDFHSGMLSQQ